MTGPLLSDLEVIEAVQRALRCSQANIHADLKCGLSVLATIALTAPLAGLLGTVMGIMTVCGGHSGQRWVVLAAMTNGIAEALIMSAAGLLVAVPAVWSYNHFVTTIEAFDIETANSSLELVTYLVAHQGLRRQAR
jgi:biopolymer transport protein ExbB